MEYIKKSIELGCALKQVYPTAEFIYDKESHGWITDSPSVMSIHHFYYPRYNQETYLNHLETLKKLSGIMETKVICHTDLKDIVLFQID